MKTLTMLGVASVLWASAAFAQTSPAPMPPPAGTIKPLFSVTFLPDADVKCLVSAVETGDPTTGRSTLILKASGGCVVPWHFHTAEEQMIVISGTVVAEMTDHRVTRLGPGGFAMMGGAHAASVHLPGQVFVFDDRRL
jgi:hypothetical protein